MNLRDTDPNDIDLAKGRIDQLIEERLAQLVEETTRCRGRVVDLVTAMSDDRTAAARLNSALESQS